MHSAVFRWKSLYISIKSLWSKVSFKASISLLIFCLNDLSIGCCFFFSSFEHIVHLLLACKVSAKKSADYLMGFALYGTSYFSLDAFKIFFFILKFCHFNYNVSWYRPLWVHLVWDSLCFLDLCVCSLPQVREIFTYYFFKYVPCSFLSLSSFWDPYNVNSLKLSSFFKILFPFYSVQLA